MRSLMIAAIAALAFASASQAANAPASGPYKFDANGKCHAAGGQMVPSNMCHGQQPVRPVCKAGVTKPCGNSCIALDKTCHKT
jgi:hypothetical protein